jgi:diadenosine tetraphosphatase ApaH/serine/threonine PP2A family protein phosphatase
MISGNHEKYVLNFDDPNTPRSGPQFETQKIIYWTYKTLSATDIQGVKEWPEMIETHLADHQFIKAVHASLKGSRVGIYPKTSEENLLNLIQTEANLFLVGHTHQPLVRTIHQTTVVNAGSIGLPFDGDTRAGYAQITRHRNQWKAKIIRLRYNFHGAIEDFYNTSFIPEGGPLTKLVLTELKIAWPQLSHWFRKYENAYLNGEISLEEAVARHLKNPNRT